MVSLDDREIENILKQFDLQTANRLRPILYANMVGGRIAFYLKNQDHSLDQYIQFVAGSYQDLSDYLYRLQVVRSEEVWLPLLEKIQQWVFALFLRRGLSKPAAEGLVKETAENTALKIIITSFPYDIPFDIWAMRITQEQCRQQIARLKRNETGG